MVTVKELKIAAKQLGLKGYSRLNKQELIVLINSVPPGSLSSSSSSKKCIGVKCPPNKICNPGSGRCELGKKISLKQKLQSVAVADGSRKKVLKSSSSKLGKKILLKSNSSKLGKKILLQPKSKWKKILSTQKQQEQKQEQKQERFWNTEEELKSDLSLMNPYVVEKTKYEGDLFLELTGMFYLLWKHKKDCVAIPPSLQRETKEGIKRVFDDRDYKSRVVPNISIISIEYVETKANEYITDDMLGKFEVSRDFWLGIKNCLKKQNIRFVVIPLGIDYNHANYLIYDKHTREMERFEPNFNFFMTKSKLDRRLKKIFNKNIPNMIKRMHGPIDFCPVANVQFVQGREREDPEGFCLAWSIWYADIRLSNPDKSRNEVINLAIEKLWDNPKSFTVFIRSYSDFLDKANDELYKNPNVEQVFAKMIKKYT